MTSRSAQFLAAMDAYDSNETELALRLMEECATLGDPLACFTTALWYRNGEGADKDRQRSNQWLVRLEELADQGNVEAQWEVAQNYRFGNLLPLDIELANYWLQRAAEGGCGAAQHHLAWYYETGQYKYSLDSIAAEEWYQRAFESEYPETLYLFAMKMFNDGKPTQDAIKLLTRAAKNGFKQAEQILKSSIN